MTRPAPPLLVALLAALAVPLACNGGDPAPPPPPPPPQAYGAALAAHLAAGGAVPGTVELADGLRVDVTHLGRGPVALPGDRVSVHLRVYGPTGNLLEDTFAAGNPMDFELGIAAVMPGLTRALDGMSVGTRAEAHLPAPLALDDGQDIRLELQLLKVR